MIPLVVLAGMAVDYSRSHSQEARLQIALDTAALAAASAYDKTESEREQLAIDMFTANFSEVDNPPTPSVAFSDDEVTVTAHYDVDTAFMHVSGTTHVNVGASSTAVAGSVAGPCIMTLEPSEKESILLNSSSEINADGCLIQVNSSDPEALVANSHGEINAEKICVDGGWDTNSGSRFTPEPEQCAPLADPLAGLPVPDEADDGCDWTDRTVTGTVTLQPGVYCEKLELDSGSRVTFEPGIYVMRDGEFIINSGSRATGNNLMIYMTGDNNPRFNFNSGSQVEFTGLETGPFAGMVIYQDRTADADFSILNSNSSSVFEGVIYLPNSALHLNSSGEISGDSAWTAVITKTLELNSNSTLAINTDYSSSSVPVPYGVGADEDQQIVRLKE